MLEILLNLGPMLWFLKYFRRKIQQKKLAFLTQNKAKLCKNLIITLVFETNANFFAENCQKSQKIVIITSVPGHTELSGENRSRHFLGITQTISSHWPETVDAFRNQILIWSETFVSMYVPNFIRSQLQDLCTPLFEQNAETKAHIKHGTTCFRLDDVRPWLWFVYFVFWCLATETQSGYHIWTNNSVIFLAKNTEM
jgi:hypothetical protein